MSDQTFDPTAKIPFRLNEQPQDTDEQGDNEPRYFVPMGAFVRMARPEPLQVENIVELMAIVYGSFHGRYNGIDVVREYSSDNIVVPMANGQVAVVDIKTLSGSELKRWQDDHGYNAKTLPEKGDPS